MSTDASGHRVESTTIDLIVKSYRLRQIDMLKIDVEGAESLVIEGAHKSLAKGIIKNIIIEVNSRSINFNSSHKKIINTLQKYNFSIFKYSADGKLCKISTVDQSSTVNLVCIQNMMLSK